MPRGICWETWVDLFLFGEIGGDVIREVGKNIWFGHNFSTWWGNILGIFVGDKKLG